MKFEVGEVVKYVFEGKELWKGTVIEVKTIEKEILYNVEIKELFYGYGKVGDVELVEGKNLISIDELEFKIGDIVKDINCDDKERFEGKIVGVYNEIKGIYEVEITKSYVEYAGYGDVYLCNDFDLYKIQPSIEVNETTIKMLDELMVENENYDELIQRIITERKCLVLPTALSLGGAFLLGRVLK